ncbi:response regulator [Alkalimonas sp. NCh-2]|uniref:response regulator n=1 Tax=Alkalimonas sp. NCh-2 TaxID=3144846 RepID=UPI0031F6CFD4
MNRLLGMGLLSVVLFTASLSFYQIHQQVRLDFQQQLQRMNQLLAKATTLLLLDGGEQDINMLYSVAQHQASFPVVSITMFDNEQAVISSTGLNPLLEQPDASWFAEQHQLHWLHQDRVLSSLPIRVEQRIEGYLLLEAGSPPFPWSLWLWQLVIWLGLPCLLLGLWLHANRQRHQLQQGLSDTEQAAMRWLAGESLLPLSRQQPFAETLYQLTDSIEQKQLAQENKLALLSEQQLQARELELSFTEQSQRYEQQQQQLKNTLTQLQQNHALLLRQLLLTPAPWQSPMLADLVSSEELTATKQRIMLADWIAAQAPGWRDSVRPEQLLTLEEDLLAFEFELDCVSAALALCCRALVRLCCQHTLHSQLSMQWQLRPTENLLHFRLVLRGESLPAAICQQLESSIQAEQAAFLPDTQLFLRARSLLQAELTVSTLDELGSSIQLTIPCVYHTCSPVNSEDKLYVLSEPVPSVTPQLQSLKCLSRQLVHCQNLSEWQDITNQPHSLKVLLLPEPDSAHTEQWLAWLKASNTIGLSSASHFAYWHAKRPGYVLAMPVSAVELLRARQSLLPTQANPFRLLVVDDNATNQAFIQAMLASTSIELSAAINGQDALQQCQQSEFELILMDIQLPDMSGMEVTRQLRQLPAFQQIPILAFTAHALPDEIEQFKQAGMDDVLIKPLDAEKIALLMNWCQRQADTQ